MHSLIKKEKVGRTVTDKFVRDCSLVKDTHFLNFKKYLKP